jgi:hypothetical protein
MLARTRQNSNPMHTILQNKTLKRPTISRVHIWTQMEDPSLSWTAIPTAISSPPLTDHQSPSTLPTPLIYSQHPSVLLQLFFHPIPCPGRRTLRPTLGTAHVHMQKPLSASSPIPIHRIPLSRSPSPSAPQHVKLGFADLASHPHTRKYKPNAVHRSTAISPAPLLRLRLLRDREHPQSRPHRHERCEHKRARHGHGQRWRPVDGVATIFGQRTRPPNGPDVLERGGRRMHTDRRCV